MYSPFNGTIWYSGFFFSEIMAQVIKGKLCLLSKKGIKLCNVVWLFYGTDVLMIQIYGNK
jgi:hypothetical protein